MTTPTQRVEEVTSHDHRNACPGSSAMRSGCVAGVGHGGRRPDRVPLSVWQAHEPVLGREALHLHPDRAACDRLAVGDSFFFVDILEDGGHDGFNDKNLYGEWYPTLSLSKLAGTEFGLGPIRGIALMGGINFDADADVLKYLPGVRVSWQVPGFAFLNTDLTAFIDASSGVMRGGAPRTSDSFMVDVNWALPFEIGGQSFAVTGHAEYIGKTTDEFGNQVRSWILAQPQLTWDLGAVFGAANQLLAESSTSTGGTSLARLPTTRLPTAGDLAALTDYRRFRPSDIETLMDCINRVRTRIWKSAPGANSKKPSSTSTAPWPAYS